MTSHLVFAVLEVTNTVILSDDNSTNLLFKNAGFKKVQIFKTNLIRALTAVTNDTCDLLILEETFDDKPTTSIIRGIREGKIGDNIFLPVIALLSSNDEKAITAGIEAGADDVVVKPLSVNIINSRIGGLLKRKMQYVVTPEYIGPTRRPEDRTGALKDQLIDVPNIMRAKSEGHDEVVAQIREEIQSASLNINNRRVSLQGDQIDGLITRLVAEPAKFDPLIKSIRKVARGFMERLKGTDFSHIGELCRMLEKVTDELAGVDDKRNIELLVLLGQAISLSFKDDEASRNRALEMAELIKKKF